MPTTRPRKKKLLLRTKKTKRTSSKVVFPLILFFIATVLISGGYMYKKVSTMFVSAQTGEVSFDNSSSLFTILVVSLNDFADTSPSIKTLDLVVLNRKDNGVHIIKIPNTTSMDVPGKYGVEKLSTVYALGLSVFDDTHKAMDLVKKTVENNSRVSINRIVLTNEETQQSIMSIVREPTYLKMSSTSVNFLLKSIDQEIQTDLTDRELYNIFTFITGDVLIQEAKYSEWERVSQEVSFSSDLADERLSVAILNGLGEEGAGKAASDIITTSGGRVTFLGNARNTYDHSIIVTTDPNSKTVAYLKNFFNIDRIEARNKYSFIEPDAERADVTLILGIDFKKVID
jgi:hypothetical protein